MLAQDYYTTHSALTDPRQYAYLFNDLPDDLPGLCQCVRNIYRHYMSDSKIPRTRKREADARYMPNMLQIVVRHDSRPLTIERPKDKRFVGCCRDAALLLCAMLRHKGLPARTRVGFAAYIRPGVHVPGFYVDHVVTEYWDDARWKLADAEQDAALIRYNQLDFDVLDIPRHQFVVGGMAWQQCRAGHMHPNNFGDHPHDQFFRGWWAIRNRHLHDLATLSKTELLLWDTWTLMNLNDKPTPADEQILDRLAGLTQAGDEAFAELRGIWIALQSP
ncbi:MAG: transglutaminase domain-containing protein [Anaerolineae bacterium]